MTRKVLAIFYSQSGQLEEIIDQFTAPMRESGIELEKVRVRTKINYPLPWTGTSFFSVMPDCVLGTVTALEHFEPRSASYDLIIFGYQAWFLSPSLPANAILHHPSLQHIFKGTPVVTITGARNMWISAMERIKPTLREKGAQLVGNIALVDKHLNLVSFVTIFHWMFSGKRDRYLNIFPKPGVGEDDIAGSRVFGNTVTRYLLEGSGWDGMQAALVSQKAVVIKYNLMFIESKARRIFAVWAGIISKKKKKTAWLVAFKYYLLIALFIAAPIILTVDAILFKPFLSARIKRQKQYYSGVN